MVRMVNSSSFDSLGSENVKREFVHAKTIPVVSHRQTGSPVEAEGACLLHDNGFDTETMSHTSQAIEPTASRTEIQSSISNKTMNIQETIEEFMSPTDQETQKELHMQYENIRNKHRLESQGNIVEKYKKVDKSSSLCCSLPLDRIKSVLRKINCINISEDQRKPQKRLLCLYCDRTFVTPNLRQKHVDRFHLLRHCRRLSTRQRTAKTLTSVCLFCDKFDEANCSLKQLFIHMVNVHPTKYFGCLECQIRFHSSVALRSHLAETHSSIIPTKSCLENKLKVNEKVVLSETEETKFLQSEHTESKIRLDGNENNNSRNKEVCETNVTELEKKVKQENKKQVVVKNHKTKKRGIISTKVASKFINRRLTRQQAKILNSHKSSKKEFNVKSTKEIVVSKVKTKSTSSYSTQVRQYPNIDFIFKYKKITDHSIDNLRIGSLTFEDVFDKAFFTRVKCNIQDNLLNYVDGKLFKNVTLENRISSFEIPSNSDFENMIPSENVVWDVFLNTVMPVTTVLTSSLKEENELTSETNKLPKKKTIVRNDEVHYKYFTRRKYQAILSDSREHRDLSKLDMWTQLAIKNRQSKILNDQRTVKEKIEYAKSEEYKTKLQVEELDRILDQRAPYENLKEEALRTSAMQKFDGNHDEDDLERYLDVQAVLMDILDKVYEELDCLNESQNIKNKCDIIVSSKPSNIGKAHRNSIEIPFYLDLEKRSLDPSTSIPGITSSEDYLGKIQEKCLELTGEWTRTKIYVCAACGLKISSLKQLIDHKNLFHSCVWCQHYEFVGSQSEMYHHLSIPGLGKVGTVESSSDNKIWRRSEARVCSKCDKQTSCLGDLHRHILECGGDQSWAVERKKHKYRPYGSKSRKKRKGLLKLIRFERKERKPSDKRKLRRKFSGPKSKPSDAESIERMLANLPPKRIVRKIMSLKDGYSRRKNKKISRKSNVMFPTKTKTNLNDQKNSVKISKQKNCKVLNRHLKPANKKGTNYFIPHRSLRKMVNRSDSNILEKQQTENINSSIKNKEPLIKKKVKSNKNSIIQKYQNKRMPSVKERNSKDKKKKYKGEILRNEVMPLSKSVTKIISTKIVKTKVLAKNKNMNRRNTENINQKKNIFNKTASLNYNFKKTRKRVKLKNYTNKNKPPINKKPTSAVTSKIVRFGSKIKTKSLGFHEKSKNDRKIIKSKTNKSISNKCSNKQISILEGNLMKNVFPNLKRKTKSNGNFVPKKLKKSPTDTVCKRKMDSKNKIQKNIRRIKRKIKKPGYDPNFIIGTSNHKSEPLNFVKESSLKITSTGFHENVENNKSKILPQNSILPVLKQRLKTQIFFDTKEHANSVTVNIEREIQNEMEKGPTEGDTAPTSTTIVEVDPEIEEKNSCSEIREYNTIFNNSDIIKHKDNLNSVSEVVEKDFCHFEAKLSTANDFSSTELNKNILSTPWKSNKYEVKKNKGRSRDINNCIALLKSKLQQVRLCEPNTKSEIFDTKFELDNFDFLYVNNSNNISPIDFSTAGGKRKDNFKFHLISDNLVSLTETCMSVPELHTNRNEVENAESFSINVKTVVAPSREIIEKCINETGKPETKNTDRKVCDELNSELIKEKNRKIAKSTAKLQDKEKSKIKQKKYEINTKDKRSLEEDQSIKSSNMKLVHLQKCDYECTLFSEERINKSIKLDCINSKQSFELDPEIRNFKIQNNGKSSPNIQENNSKTFFLDNINNQTLKTSKSEIIENIVTNENMTFNESMENTNSEILENRNSEIISCSKHMENPEKYGNKAETDVIQRISANSFIRDKQKGSTDIKTKITTKTSKDILNKSINSQNSIVSLEKLNTNIEGNEVKLKNSLFINNINKNAMESINNSSKLQQNTIYDSSNIFTSKNNENFKISLNPKSKIIQNFKDVSTDNIDYINGNNILSKANAKTETSKTDDKTDKKCISTNKSLSNIWEESKTEDVLFYEYANNPNCGSFTNQSNKTKLQINTQESDATLDGYIDKDSEHPKVNLLLGQEVDQKESNAELNSSEEENKPKGTENILFQMGTSTFENNLENKLADDNNVNSRKCSNSESTIERNIRNLENTYNKKSQSKTSKTSTPKSNSKIKGNIINRLVGVIDKSSDSQYYDHQMPAIDLIAQEETENSKQKLVKINLECVNDVKIPSIVQNDLSKLQSNSDSEDDIPLAFIINKSLITTPKQELNGENIDKVSKSTETENDKDKMKGHPQQVEVTKIERNKKSNRTKLKIAVVTNEEGKNDNAVPEFENFRNCKNSKGDIEKLEDSNKAIVNNKMQIQIEKERKKRCPDYILKQSKSPKRKKLNEKCTSPTDTLVKSNEGVILDGNKKIYETEGYREKKKHSKGNHRIRKESKNKSATLKVDTKNIPYHNKIKICKKEPTLIETSRSTNDTENKVKDINTNEYIISPVESKYNSLNNEIEMKENQVMVANFLEFKRGCAKINEKIKQQIETPLTETTPQTYLASSSRFAAAKDSKQDSKSLIVRDKNTKKFSCDICHKVFRRTDSLTKHKRTLTHIARLSELEAKEIIRNNEAEADLSDLEKNRDVSLLELRTNTKTEEISLEKNSIDVDNSFFIKDSKYISSPIITPESKCKELRNEDTLLTQSIHCQNNHKLIDSNLFSQNTSTSRKVNGREAIKLNNSMNAQLKFPTNSLNNAGSTDCSLSRDGLNCNISDKHKLKPQTSFTFFSQNILPVKEKTTVEKISEDSLLINQKFEQVSRKVLNHDEELFLECCSLLKSGSEILGPPKVNGIATVFLKKENHLTNEPKQFEEISKTTLYTKRNSFDSSFPNSPSTYEFNSEFSNTNTSVIKNIEDLQPESNDDPNKQIDAVLFNKYKNVSKEGSNSDMDVDNSLDSFPNGNSTISKIYENKLTPANGFHDSHTTNSKIIHENQYTFNKRGLEESFSGKKLPFHISNNCNIYLKDGDKFKAEYNSDEEEIHENKNINFCKEVVSRFGSLVTKALRNRYKTVTASGGKRRHSVAPVNALADERGILNLKCDRKGILTKGAMKTFDKSEVTVSENCISHLNTSLVISPLDNNKESTNDPINEYNKEYTSLENEIKIEKFDFHHGISNNVKNDGIKKTNCDFRQSNENSFNSVCWSSAASYDIYEFEETQDNSMFSNNLTTFRSFRNKSVEDVNTFIAVESDGPCNSPLTTKLKSNTNITKKKCKIMGKIFKNSCKSNTGSIKCISLAHNSNDFLESCNTVPLSLENEEKNHRLSQEEMDLLFNRLIEEKDPDMGKIQNQGDASINENPENLVLDLFKDKKISKIQHKNKRKRRRKRNSESSTDEEFNLNKMYKRKANTEGGINLEQELKECIGVASRKSQRKCTSGKQNVLVEYWSSDDSVSDIFFKKQIPDSSAVYETHQGDKIKYKKVENMSSKLDIQLHKDNELETFQENKSKSHRQSRYETYSENDTTKNNLCSKVNADNLCNFNDEMLENHNSSQELSDYRFLESKAATNKSKIMFDKWEQTFDKNNKLSFNLEVSVVKRKQQKKHNNSGSNRPEHNLIKNKKRRSSKKFQELENVKKRVKITEDLETIAKTKQKRSNVDTLYYWPSSSDDEQDIIEVKTYREEMDYSNEGRPLQHGWIVGDSPKKLVTMLAQAKGKKIDINCVKEQNKR